MRRSNSLTGATAGALLAAASALASDAQIDVPDAAETCLSCHAIRPGEPELEGPPLWQVVGRRIASVEGYEYSAALRSQTGTWDRATLDRFIAAPQQFAPGANMTFGGVRDPVKRAAVLDFLETLRPTGAAPDGTVGGDAQGNDSREGRR